MTKTIDIVRMVLKWSYESELIEVMPRFGPDFKGVSNRKVRQQKAIAGAKLFTSEEIRLLVDTADATMQAMILLGIKCNDCRNRRDREKRRLRRLGATKKTLRLLAE